MDRPPHPPEGHQIEPQGEIGQVRPLCHEQDGRQYKAGALLRR